MIRSLHMRKARRETAACSSPRALRCWSPPATPAGSRRSWCFSPAARATGWRATWCAGRRPRARNAWRCRRPCWPSLPPRRTPRPCSRVFEQVWHAAAVARGRRGRCAVGGAGGRARPRQSRHHHPHRRRRRRKRHRADRGLRRPLFARGGARHHGLDFQRAAGAREPAGRPGVGARAGPATSSARISTRARISGPLAYRQPTLLLMGSEGPGLSARAERGLHPPCQDPDGGPHRFAQPRGGGGADALRDAKGAAAAVRGQTPRVVDGDFELPPSRGV